MEKIVRLSLLAFAVSGLMVLSGQYASRNLSENLGAGALPGACTVGDIAFRTDPATAGQQLYGCTAVNTWTLLGDGGGGSTFKEEIWLLSAFRRGSGNLEGPFFNAPNAGYPSIVLQGTSPHNHVSYIFDKDTDETLTLYYPLPSTWTGNTGLRFVWISPAANGDVVWAAQTVCVAASSEDFLNPAYNAVQTVTDSKTTQGYIEIAEITPLTMTGCAADEMLSVRFYRDADDGADTLDGDAPLFGVQLYYDRSLVP